MRYFPTFPACDFCKAPYLTYTFKYNFAQIIKTVVNDKVQEGLTEKEVYNFLSEKYGDWILFNTPVKKNSYLLWFLPYLLFILGGLILYLMIKKRLIEKK